MTTSTTSPTNASPTAPRTARPAPAAPEAAGCAGSPQGLGVRASAFLTRPGVRTAMLTGSAVTTAAGLLAVVHG